MTSKRPKHDRSEHTKDARKITDFFCPISSRSNNRTNVASETMSCASPETRNVHIHEDPVPVRKSSRLPRPTAKAEPYIAASSKRTRSAERPEVSPRTRRKKPSTNKDQLRLAKRQKKFESDLDISMDDAGPIIYVKSAQLGHVESDSQNGKIDPGRFESIPTSQSDEMELEVTHSFHRNSQETNKCVEEWHSEGRPAESDTYMTTLSNLHIVAGAQIQDPDTETLPSPLFSALSTPNSAISDPFHGPDANCSHFTPDTPPVSEHCLSPVPLDENAKTAQLIEKIKAEAQAKVQQLDDSPLLQFNDVLDSSSDEDEGLFSVSLDTREKRKSRELSREQSYTFRQSGHSSKSLSPSLRRVSLLPKKAGNGKRLPTSYNPLDALLLEKRRLEKAGKDVQAFIRAESTLKLGETSQEDSFDNEYASERWLDENAAQDVVREVQSNDFGENELMDVSLDGEQAAKLIGADGIKVANILKRDKVHEEQDTRLFRAGGLRLWMTSTHCAKRVQQDCQSHSFQYCGVNPVVNMLKVALEQQDYLQANLILESGVLSNVDLSDCEDLLSFLCKEAFSYSSCIIQAPACVALSSIYARHNFNTPPFAVAWLLDCFAELGAEPSILELMGYDYCNVGEKTYMDGHLREVAMLRLVYLLHIVGQSRQVAIKDVPDFVIAMQRVSLDPTTSGELRTGVTRIVDMLCNLATAETERLICEKAVFFNMTLEMPYKAQFASVFSNGSGTTRRIARWVAFSTLTNQAFSFEGLSGSVPPLSKLLHIVETVNTLHMKDEVDYTMLWYSVQMLGIALTDVELYDIAERNAPQSPIQSGSPNKGKSKSMIILIHDSLERLHAEIEDTRALRLDRSRVKAAIKQLSLRLRYQHSDYARNRAFQSGMPRRKTLDHFFSPKKSQ